MRSLLGAPFVRELIVAFRSQVIRLVLELIVEVYEATTIAQLFDSYRLREVSRLVDIRALQHSDMIGQKL